MPSLASQLGVTDIGIAAMPRESQRDRIIAVIRARIEDGTYPAGEAIPSQAQLVAEFGVSPQPVRAALDRLKWNGELIPRQGKGNFVPPLD